MNQKKYLFIDRDGTLIKEPADEQVDSYDKFELLDGVIFALQKLQAENFKLVMISNQDGLDTESFPQEDFEKPQNLLLKILKSQGIQFESIRICPHLSDEKCECRKPKIGLLLDLVKDQIIDKENSYVIGDRDSDLQLAENLGIKGIKINSQTYPDWNGIVTALTKNPREAMITRRTKETDITLRVNLDDGANVDINTGIAFFDHMLEQIAYHADITMEINAVGDLQIDDHHTVEDVAIVFGQGLRKALGEKLGIERYGFLLPMDESLAQVAIDLSGRGICEFQGVFNREKVGELSTELVPHFFQTLSAQMGAAIHIKLTGENTHHMIEAAFKGFGRCLKQAIKKNGYELPSSKGVL